MCRREIKKRISFQIWTAVPCFENYEIDAAGSDFLGNIRFIYPLTIHLREVSLICDDSLRILSYKNMYANETH